MKKRLLSLILVFTLLFSFIAVTSLNVYATDPATAVLISESVWASSGSTLLSEALATYGSLGATALSTCAVVVGSAVFTYVATKGIEFAVDTSLNSAATLGRYLISNASDLAPELQRYIASTIFNIDTDVEFYKKYNSVYTARLLNDIDEYLGNYVDTSVIQMNEGLVSQSVIPLDVFETMTTSTYDVYCQMNRPVFEYNSPSDVNECYIYEMPVGISTLFFDTLYDQIFFYYSDGTRYTEYPSGLITLRKYGTAVEGTGLSGWSSYRRDNYYFNFSTGTLLDGLIGWDFNGYEIIIGDSYETAVSKDVEYPLDIDKSNEYSNSIILEEDLTVSVDDAIALGTGEKTLDDVGAVYTDDGDILYWIKVIWQSICDLPTSLGDMLRDVLEDLFLPTEETVAECEGLLHQKLPIIYDLQSFTEEIVDILDHPEDYASSLSFTVDFSKAENTYWNWGDGTANFLDLSWYVEKFKPLVDDIIVGVSWLVFLWNLHCQLPNIISAVGTVTFATAQAPDNIQSRKEQQQLREERQQNKAKKGKK